MSRVDTDGDTGTDNDIFQIGKGTTIGTTPYMTFSASGDVGIGTTSPAARFQVEDSTNENVMTILGQTGTGGRDTTITLGSNTAGSVGEKYITYRNADTGTSAWMVGMGDDEKFHFDYGAVGEITENNGGLTLSQNGNLGIANTTPVEKLDIGHLLEATSTATQQSSEKISFTGGFWNGVTDIHHSFKLQNIASTTVNETGRLATFWDSTELMSVTNNGKVGIGTTTPTFTLDVSGDANISTNLKVGIPDAAYGSIPIKLFIRDDFVNTNARGINEDLRASSTVNGTYLTYGGVIKAQETVGTGVTNSGDLNGVWVSSFRNNLASADDSGTLTNLRSMYLQYGHNNIAPAATPATTTAYGLYMQPYIRTGTITNMYDIYLTADITGGTATNRYGIYQANTGKNYFNGSVGIGVTAPTAALHLKAGTAALNTAPLKLTSGVNLTAPEAGAIEYDGTNLFYTDSGAVRRTLASTSGGGSFTNVTSITGSGALSVSAGGTNQNLTLAGSGTGLVTTASPMTITNATASTASNNGALVVTGGVGIGGALNVSGDINSNSSVRATTSMFTPLIYGGTAASGDLTLDSTSHATKGNIILNPTGGNVGIGVATPAVPMHIAKAVDGDATLLSLDNKQPNSAGSTNEMATMQFSFAGLRAGKIVSWKDGDFTSGPNSDAKMSFYTERDGAPTHIMTFQAGGLISTGSVAAAAGGVALHIGRDVAPVELRLDSTGYFPSVGDKVGSFTFHSQNSVGTTQQYAAILSKVLDPVAGSTDGSLEFQTLTNSAISTKMTILGDGNVGIGTATPTAKLVTATDGTSNQVISQTAAASSSSPGFMTRASRGTIAAPTASQSGDQLGFYGLSGYDGAGFFLQSYMESFATETWTGSTSGASLGFNTTPNGSTSVVRRLTLTDTGNVGIGVTTPTTGTRLDIAGATSSDSSIIIPRATVANRPGVGVNGMMRYASDTNKFEAYQNGAWLDMIGTATSVTAGAGTVSAPSISFSGDSNTGFYSSGDGTIGVTSNGAQVFNISSTSLSSPTTGGALITSGNGTAGAPTFSFAGDPDTGWFRPTADTLAASTAGVERMRLSSTGQVFFGPTTAPNSSFFNITLDGVAADSDDNLKLTEYTGATTANFDLDMRRARGSLASPAIIQSGDYTGSFKGEGYDGANFRQLGYIAFAVDGTPGASDMPGRMEFFTTPDGSATPLNRMTIKNDGKVFIGPTTAPLSSIFNITLDGVAADSADNLMLTEYTGATTANFDFDMRRARGTLAAPTIVQSGDFTAAWKGMGYDGANFRGLGSIRFTVDGTPGVNDMPGRIEFQTTPDGSSTSATRMTINNSGNVGIGTDAPARKLAVVASSGSASMSVQNLSTSGWSSVLFQDSSGSTVGGLGYGNASAAFYNDIFYIEGTGKDIGFFTAAGSEERMRIVDTTGNVGIGTSSPSTALDVAASTGAYPRGISSTQYSTDGMGAGFSVRKSRGTLASPTAVVNGDWIGALTATPYDGSSWLSTGYAGFVTNGTIAVGSVPTDYAINLGSSGNGTEKFRITSAGNVGIGTASPTYPLHISKLGTSGVDTTFLTLTDTRQAADANITAGDGVTLRFSNVSNSNRMASIHALAETNGSGASALTFQTNPGAGATEKLRITSVGNVGIGVAAPAAKLDVRSNAVNAIVSGGQGTGNYGAMIAASSRGTIAAPTATQSGDITGVFGSFGYGATTFPAATKAAMRAVASENWTDAAQGLQLIFDTTPNGSTTNTDRMIITSSGNVGIGTNTPNSKLEVVGGSITTAFSDIASASADFTTANTIRTSAAAGTLTLSNMRDGTSYTLILSGTGTFTLSGSGVTTWRCSPGCPSAQIYNDSGHVLITILKAGTTAYVSYIVEMQ